MGNEAWAKGSAISLGGIGESTITNTVFDSNIGESLIWAGDITMEDVIFQNNNSGASEMIHVGGGAKLKNVALVNNIIAGSSTSSSAAALYFSGWTDGVNIIPEIINCTFNNMGSRAIFLYCPIVTTNPVIVKNSIYSGSEENIKLADWGEENLQLDISYSLLEGGIESITYEGDPSGDILWGEGNFDADPLFVDIEDGDFTLQSISPCIDTGDPESDLDPDDTRADMGAYYFDQDENPINWGCLDSLAVNYDPDAENDNGTFSLLEF